MTRGIFAHVEPARRNACVRLNNEQREFVRHPRGSQSDRRILRGVQTNEFKHPDKSQFIVLFFNHTVGIGYRILENVEGWGSEGEKDKEQGYYAEGEERDFGVFAGASYIIELFCFVDICDCCCDEENWDIYPIGWFSDDSVIGIKNYWNEGESYECAFELDAPEIWFVFIEKALDDGKEEHWEEE